MSGTAWSALADQLGLTQPTTSKHLRVLRDAGFIHVQPDAQRRIYAIDPTPLVALDEWLTPYRLWNEASRNAAE
jgi:DNA-binding transcriptional ArsR family regulator